MRSSLIVAVDIAGAEETHAPAGAHHNGKVLVAQLGLHPAVELETEDVIGVAGDRGKSTTNLDPRKLRS